MWDFGRWDGWGIILELIPLEFHGIWSHKTRETLIFLYLKASPLPPALFDSCGLGGCLLAGLQLAGRLAGFLTGLLVGLPADFDWQDMQDWQGAEQK